MQVNANALSAFRTPLRFGQNQSETVVRSMDEESARRLPQVPGQQRVQLAEGVYADISKPEDNMGATIGAKMTSGKPLTNEELAWLRENDPVGYQKALFMKMEREAYKRELENCRSKEEVAQVKQRKMEMFCTEAGKITSSSMSADDKKDAMMTLEYRRRAIEDEHKTFTDSSRYKMLPQKRKEKDEKTIRDPEDDKQLQQQMKDAAKAAKEAKEAEATRQQPGAAEAPAEEAGAAATGQPTAPESAAPPSETPAAAPADVPVQAPPPEAPAVEAPPVQALNTLA